jgi:hypothetical protein
MLPERNELKILHQQLAEMEEMDEEFELELDNVYLDTMFRSVLRNDGEDHKRMALMDFDVIAHRRLLADLEAEGQFVTARVIKWYLDEYVRLFPTRDLL